MKYLVIFLFLFLISTISFAQNKYIPFIGQNKYWIYSQQDDWEPSPNTIGGFIFTFGSDTIIKGITYSKLIKYGLDGENSCPSRPCFTPYFPYQINTNFQTPFAYLREDTLSKKVYCLPAIDFSKFCDTTEHVLYDFNQEVGDTLIMCNLLIHSGWPISDRYFKIDSIKTEIIYSKIRKVLYFNGFSYGGMPVLLNMKMIEGVGLEHNLGFYIDNTATFVSFCEGTIEQCNIISSTKDEKESTHLQLTLFPNPVWDILKINTDINLVRVDIFDQNGRVILTSFEMDINVSELLPGVYFTKCFDVNNKQYFSKFIKM